MKSVLARNGLLAMVVVVMLGAGCHPKPTDPYLHAFSELTEVYRSIETGSPMPCSEAQSDADGKLLQTNPRIDFLEAKALDPRNPYAQEAAIWTFYYMKWPGLAQLLPSIVARSDALLSLTAIGTFASAKGSLGDPVPAFTTIIAADPRPTVLRGSVMFARFFSKKQKEVIAKALTARLNQERKSKHPNSELIETLEKYNPKLWEKP